LHQCTTLLTQEGIKTTKLKHKERLNGRIAANCIIVLILPQYARKASSSHNDESCHVLGRLDFYAVTFGNHRRLHFDAVTSGNLFPTSGPLATTHCNE
jgi:hypothetical protein